MRVSHSGTGGGGDQEMGGSHGCGCPRSQRKETFQRGSLEDVSDLPTLPWLCMVREPPRKSPRMNKDATLSRSHQSRYRKDTRARVFSLHMHGLRQDHMTSTKGNQPQAWGRALRRNQVTWKWSWSSRFWVGEDVISLSLPASLHSALCGGHPYSQGLSRSWSHLFQKALLDRG